MHDFIQNEKDHDFFESHGFICEIIRHPTYKTLCGYVYVDKNHKMYGVDYDEMNFDVHGGVTFSALKGKWWSIGFDTSHIGDYSPGMVECTGMCISSDVYRNWDYVVEETKNLAAQMAQKQSGTVTPDVIAKLLLTLE